MKKKILFIHHASGWGGAPINMLNIINACDSEKYLFEVLLLKESVVSDFLIKNGIKFRLAKSNFYRKYYTLLVHSDASERPWYRLDFTLRAYFSWFLSKYYFAEKELVNIDCDIIHLNSSALTDWLKPGSKKAKVVIHIQEPFKKGFSGFRKNLLLRQMRKYASKIIAISIDNASRINLPEKTEIVYNFTPIADESIINSPSLRSNKVLYLGGALSIKGFFVVVKALDYLPPHIKVLFCGNYPSFTNKKISYSFIRNVLEPHFPLKRKMQRAMNKIVNHPNAEFIGLIPESSQLIQKSDLLISPFTKPHFSRPIIEAFANGRTVIASDVESTNEIVENNVDGLIIKKGDPRELASAITYLISNDEVRVKFGKNGYAKACRLFSREPNILKLQQIYDTL